MSDNPTSYLSIAKDYHAFGANVLPIGNNEDAPKAPNTLYTDPPHDYKQRRQRAYELDAMRTKHGDNAWSVAAGVAIIQGVGCWRCVDVDAIKGDDNDGVPFDVVEAICKRLGLDAYEYPWIVRTGSGGWHLWTVCTDELPTDQYPGVSWGKLRPREQYADRFDHCELRWSNGYAVAPPSVLANGARYSWHHGTPTTPPATVGVADILNALRAVVALPEPVEAMQTADVAVAPEPRAIRATSHELIDGPWYDSTTGQMWATLSEYEQDEQSAKDNARARFDLVAYIREHLGTDYTERVPNGETRIGKPGAGLGGWFVTSDGMTWNTFVEGDGGTTGGDCFALVCYALYRTTTTKDANQWRDVLATVEQVTGVHIPQRTRRQPTTAPVGGTTDGDDGTNVGKPRHNGKPTKEETVLEFLQPFRFRTNELNGDIEWQPTDGDAETWHQLNDEQVKTWVVETALETGVSVRVETFGCCIAYKSKPYDPIREYFDGLGKWDGTDHIRALCSLVQAHDPELFHDHLRKWLIGTYATGYYGAMRLRTLNDTLFILHGEQGTGKTTFLTRLVPAPLERYRCFGPLTNDKDGKMLQTETFIWLNDELDGLGKREVSEIKALLSNTEYKYRRPFQQSNKLWRRRVSFCGSTNEDAFLTDHTGNRRYMAHTIAGVDFEALQGFDINNVWRQARALHEAGERHWLNTDDVARQRQHNQRFVQLSYTDGLLTQYFRPCAPEHDDARHLTTNEIAQRIAELYDKAHTTLDADPTGNARVVRDGTKRPDPERILLPLGRSLRKQGYERSKARRGVATVWGYWLREVTPHDKISDELSKQNPGDLF
jgi:hypothetical protein